MNINNIEAIVCRVYSLVSGSVSVHDHELLDPSSSTAEPCEKRLKEGLHLLLRLLFIAKVILIRHVCEKKGSSKSHHPGG